MVTAYPFISTYVNYKGKWRSQFKFGPSFYKKHMQTTIPTTNLYIMEMLWIFCKKSQELLVRLFIIQTKLILCLRQYKDWKTISKDKILSL